jgi:PAS domain-containing protein
VIVPALFFRLRSAIIGSHHSSDEFIPMRHEDLRKLVDGTKDAAYVVDTEGLVVAWNEGAQKLFGLTAGEAIGQPCHSIVRGMDESGAVCSKN